MNSTLIRLSIFSVAVASLISACKGSGGVETDKDTGIQYQLFNHDEKGSKPSIGDYATLKMVYHAVTPSGTDTEMFNTMKNRRPGDTTGGTITIPLTKTFNGCVEQAVTLMAVGDSAMFKINIDSLFLKTFHQKQLPKFVKSGTMATFNVKLVRFQTQQQMQQQQQAAMAKRQAEMEQRKSLEAPAIAKWLADNHYDKVKPTADSLFVLERSGGKGRAIQEGDSVKALYTGSLLNGTVFDASSKHGNQPFGVLYTGKEMHIIKGWAEMLGTMHEGEKAKILLPSSLAYGAQQASADILPYSPLVFELEIVKVTPNKKMPAKPATK